MKVDLTGKRALVTGASRGIGRAIAVELAKAGATVCIHFHSDDAAARETWRQAGGEGYMGKADLADPQACHDLWKEALEAMGGLDVLVNNAGVALQATEELGQDEWLKKWDATLAVNLRAPALLCREACRHFAARDGGRIINISSRAAVRGDTPEYAAYAASKGGLNALSRTIARGWGKKGVKAFVVAPGFTRTDMAQQFIDTYGEGYALDDIALDRLTEPMDIAPLVVLLASGLADHATGGTFDVNAGSYVH